MLQSTSAIGGVPFAIGGVLVTVGGQIFHFGKVLLAILGVISTLAGQIFLFERVSSTARKQFIKGKQYKKTDGQVFV